MSNNLKGRTLLLEIFDSGVYKILGGITTKSLSRDNPVSDATSSSTPDTSNETEACFNGFGTLTINGNGLVDTRSSATLLAYKIFSAITQSSNPVANLRFRDSQESWAGNFLITSFEKSAEINGLVEFSASFQNEGEITYA